MPSHSEGLGIWLSVWRFLLTQCLYERAAKVLARLRGCAGSPEPSLLAKGISTKFAWRGPSYEVSWEQQDYQHGWAITSMDSGRRDLASLSSSPLYMTSQLVPYCSINAYKGSFFPSAVCLWHSLPGSACQCHISTNYGWLQDPHQCWYPKTVTVNNVLLTDFNCMKSLPAQRFLGYLQCDDGNHGHALNW